MEIQKDLFNTEREFRTNKELKKLKPNCNYLGDERKKFRLYLSDLIDVIDFNQYQYRGRPSEKIQDIIKCLTIMSFEGISYKRAESDFVDLLEKGFITKIPSKSTLCKYMDSIEFQKIIESIIQQSAKIFIDYEDTLVFDSTWFSHSMYGGGYVIVHDKKTAPLDKCTKLHIAGFKNSKIIAAAFVTKGTKHDCPMFKKILTTTYANGFFIKNLLADAAYCSKDNYSLCKNLNIINSFIDFSIKAKLNNKGRTAYMERLKVYVKNPDDWHEVYRFRVIIEGIFSSMKKKTTRFLRSRNQTARENELLLKALVYNITVIGRFF
jgi:hypothetical protein